MNHELALQITDAIARLDNDYQFEIGPRGMVALTLEITDVIERHYGSPTPLDEGDIVIELEPHGVDSEEDERMQAYTEGYSHGVNQSRRPPIEIYDNARATERGGMVDEDFEQGFRHGMVNGAA
jgi:hypothetical protein